MKDVFLALRRWGFGLRGRRQGAWILGFSRGRRALGPNGSGPSGAQKKGKKHLRDGFQASHNSFPSRWNDGFAEFMKPELDAKRARAFQHFRRSSVDSIEGSLECKDL
jgi:hypothetical protein